ncbi:PRELI domain-containing protein 2-like isoform X2 [Dreissena polymorpha]|uniref:PRELI domain-containing protein 2-like isoform X2 n=1 Tax=Dreissena polymorpha TaxID=45954 RepID=UPI0022640C22|nr:PRELI domain-containing protein 2-like isoform X2 [Dreissena polymorpha]
MTDTDIISSDMYPSDKEKFVKKLELKEVQEDSKQWTTYRRSIAHCLNPIPGILRRIPVLNEPAILLEEESWLNCREKELSLKSKNLTWETYASLREQSVFRPHAENPDWTVMAQEGIIDIHGIGPFGRVIEMFAETFLYAGIRRGFAIMEDRLMEMKDTNSFEDNLNKKEVVSTKAAPPQIVFPSLSDFHLILFC